MMTREQIENMTFKQAIEWIDAIPDSERYKSETLAESLMFVESLLAKVIALSETSEGL
jgi:hypothetical protein